MQKQTGMQGQGQPSSGKIASPKMSFATLDAGDDVDVDRKIETGGGGHHFGHFDSDLLDDDTMGSLMWPICLILIWLVVYQLEIVLTDTDAVGLRHWPVVMGNISSIGILKPMTAWVAKIMLAHRFFGALLFIFNRILVFIAMIICSITAGFIHTSLGHLLGNAIILLIVSGAVLAVGYPLGRFMKNWLILSATGIGFTWLICDLISFFFQHTKDTTSWFYVLVHSTTPIVGASVGVFGLLGLSIVLMAKSVNDSRVAQILLIVLIIMSAVLLFLRFGTLSGLHYWTNTGAAIKLGTIMHFVGFGLGLIRGIHDRTFSGYY